MDYMIICIIYVIFPLETAMHLLVYELTHVTAKSFYLHTLSSSGTEFW